MLSISEADEGTYEWNMKMKASCMFKKANLIEMREVRILSSKCTWGDKHRSREGKLVLDKKKKKKTWNWYLGDF